jgi:hypothetical protein
MRVQFYICQSDLKQSQIFFYTNPTPAATSRDPNEGIQPTVARPRSPQWHNHTAHTEAYLVLVAGVRRSAPKPNPTLSTPLSPDTTQHNNCNLPRFHRSTRTRPCPQIRIRQPLFCPGSHAVLLRPAASAALFCCLARLG